MLFCPQCKNEFCETLTVCSKCNVPLVNKLPEEKCNEFSSNIPEHTEQITSDTPALLCSVNNNIEATIVESLLKSHNIPVMKKWRHGGDMVMLYMGVSSTGADLYVPSALLEEANLLLSADAAIPEEDFSTSKDYSEYTETVKQGRRNKARVMLICLFILSFMTLIALRHYIFSF